ncbi:MAG: Bug family tripartite tricarboxylate transporter substrate binding protein [Burkholderiaceae bacterium]
MHPHRRRLIGASAATAGLTAWPLSASAQQVPWPSRPVTLVSPYNPGGTNDVPARLFGDGFEKLLGQRFLIRNQPGAAAIVGSKAVMAAPPDGYTLLSTNIGGMVVQATAKKPPPYHPLKDFTPIVQFVQGAIFIGVRADLPVKDVGELIALARKEPGKLTYSSAGSGSFGNLMGEYFKMLTGTDILHVPGKGSASAVLEMKAGRIDLMLDPIVLPQSTDGRIRVLAVAGRERTASVPNIPTVREAGGPDMDLQGWFGLFGPAGLPAEVVGKLEQASRTVIADPEVQKKFLALGISPVMLDTASFRTRIEADYKLITEIITRAKLTID